MLNKNIDKRVTLLEVQTHPWLKVSSSNNLTREKIEGDDLVCFQSPTKRRFHYCIDTSVLMETPTTSFIEDEGN